MPFAIMRCKKLASMGSAAASLQHCYRERETHNADGNRTPDNQHFAAKSTDEAIGKLRELLPDKYRKDAVLAVEYVMTASPEWWEKASKQEQDEFFQRSREWLANKYGEDRIITSTVHRDETSPHLSAFVVPLTKDGRLSAKEFIGGRNQMSQDQTTFAKAVKHLGLERGIENSKAKHTTIQSYYARVNSPMPKPPKIEVPKPEFTDKVKTEDYGKRVAQSVIEQINPYCVGLFAKATAGEAREKVVVAREKGLDAREKAVELREKAVEGVEIKSALNGDLRRENRSLRTEVEQLRRDMVGLDDLKVRASKADSAEEINKVLANAIIKGGETLEAARTRLKELFPEKFEKSKSSNDDLDFGH
jgi:hypothetical protein